MVYDIICSTRSSASARVSARRGVLGNSIIIVRIITTITLNIIITIVILVILIVVIIIVILIILVNNIDND